MQTRQACRRHLLLRPACAHTPLQVFTFPRPPPPLPVPRSPPLQPSEEFVEGLRAKPWWEPEEFEWVSEMEERSSVVIDEFKEFWNDPMSGFAKDSVNMNIMGKGWSGVRLQRLGEWIPENCEKFPKTVELLKELEIPLAVRGVMFARQVPGSGVSPHTDGRNFILTTHLGEPSSTPPHPARRLPRAPTIVGLLFNLSKTAAVVSFFLAEPRNLPKR